MRTIMPKAVTRAAVTKRKRNFHNEGTTNPSSRQHTSTPARLPTLERSAEDSNLSPLPHQTVPEDIVELAELAGTGNSATPTTSTLSKREQEEMLQEREQFILFVRVLMKYLDTKDPAMHNKVKLIIKDCAARNKRQERGYESATASMRKQLKSVVSETYWKRAEKYLANFMAKKEANVEKEDNSKKEENAGKKLGVSNSREAAGRKRLSSGKASSGGKAAKKLRKSGK